MKLNIMLFMVSGVIALMVGAGVVWLMSITKATTPAVAPVTMEETAFDLMSPTQPISGTGSLAMLQELETDMECAFSFTDEEMYSEGTGFFADGKIRIDALGSTVTGTTTELTSVIVNTDTMYMWGTADMGNFAFMLPMSAVAQNEQATYFTDEANVSYTCSVWEVDQSIFVPPANIEFLNLAQLLPQT